MWGRHGCCSAWPGWQAATSFLQYNFQASCIQYLSLQVFNTPDTFRVSGVLNLQLSKVHMLLQPPNTHLSLPAVIPTPALSAACLICSHYAACTIPILPSSVRAIPPPNSPSNLEDASTSTNVGHKSWHVIYSLFYSIGSLITPREPLLPRNHKPQTTTEGSMEFWAAISAKYARRCSIFQPSSLQTTAPAPGTGAPTSPCLFLRSFLLSLNQWKINHKLE